MLAKIGCNNNPKPDLFNSYEVLSYNNINCKNDNNQHQHRNSFIGEKCSIK